MSDDKKGMYRHVDILGRVVIPREVRKSLRINYGDLMEFVVKDNKQVIMRKFELLDDLIPFIINIVKLVKLNNQINIIVTDKEKVLCHNDKVILDNNLNEEFIKILDNRKEIKKSKLIVSKDIALQGECVIVPILLQGDILGGIVLEKDNMTQDYIDIANQIANIVCKYFACE